MADPVLHIYHCEDSGEWVVATSPEDAYQVWKEEFGEDLSAEDFNFKAWPDDKPLKITDEDEGPVEKMPAEWIAELGSKRQHWFSADV